MLRRSGGRAGAPNKRARCGRRYFRAGHSPDAASTNKQTQTNTGYSDRSNLIIGLCGRVITVGVAKLKNIAFEQYVWYSVGNFLLISEVSAQTVEPLRVASDFHNPRFCVNNGNFRVNEVNGALYFVYLAVYSKYRFGTICPVFSG